MSVASTQRPAPRAPVGWRDVRRLVRERIVRREWKPGDAIPKEADLAAELGCARATVNRALRDLADEGLIDRRRRSGSRVAEAPSRRATFRIPIIAAEIADRGMVPGYRRLLREVVPAPGEVTARMVPGAASSASNSSRDDPPMGTPPIPLLHVVSLHLADGRPFMLEDRWIDPTVFPAAAAEPFDVLSANEWLVTHAPFDHGEIAFGACAAGRDEADALRVRPGAAVFVVRRVTFSTAGAPRALTDVRQVFAPGYEMRSVLP